MATPSIGKVTEFNPEENQETESYLEKFEWFCEANNIAEERKKAVFLASVGTKTYDILRRLCEPKLLKEKTFGEIVTLFRTLGCNNTQHSSSQLNADEPIHGQEHRHEIIKTEKPSTSSASHQSQAKKVRHNNYNYSYMIKDFTKITEHIIILSIHARPT